MGIEFIKAFRRRVRISADGNGMITIKLRLPDCWTVNGADKPVSGLNKDAFPQSLYPQCIGCSLMQIAAARHVERRDE
jgi:hypothetical protein